jgi:fused signal recognition particle receptor
MWARLKERLGLAKPQDEPSSPSAHPKEGASPAFTTGFGTAIKEKTLDDVLGDLEIVLLESDVAFEVVQKIQARVREELKGKKIKWGEEASAAIEHALRSYIRTELSLKPIDLEKSLAASPKPYTILFLGVNGSGKTTSLAKLAHRLSKQGHGVVIAAADTFRAGAIEQLEVHGERLGIRVVRQKEGADPAAVAFDAVQHASKRHSDVVLIDTAGRQHTNENLIEEAKKIRRVVHPSLTLFVGDALSGNDMVEQAKLFNKELGFDGVILTKLDADVKGGAALSVASVVHKPILFVGLGQGYDDLKPFDIDWMLARIFANNS